MLSLLSKRISKGGTIFAPVQQHTVFLAPSKLQCRSFSEQNKPRILFPGILINSTISHQFRPSASNLVPSIGLIRWKTYNKRDKKKLDRSLGPQPGDPDYATRYEPDNRMIADIANSIDTTLSPEQREYVEKIKKKYKGGINSPRSLYRDVPRPEEVEGLGNFMPLIADNAEALIDYALSHIPPRAGPRRSRRKKRMALKQSTMRAHDAIKKKQIHEANLRRHQRFKRISTEIREIKLQAQEINAKRINAKLT